MKYPNCPICGMPAVSKAGLFGRGWKVFCSNAQPFWVVLTMQSSYIIERTMVREVPNTFGIVW